MKTFKAYTFVTDLPADHKNYKALIPYRWKSILRYKESLCILIFK